MAESLLLALNGPTVPDAEKTYNRWYDDIHVPDLSEVPGVKSAQRYKVVQNNVPLSYVAAYEIGTDDLADVMWVMGHQPRPFDPSFDRLKSAPILSVAV